MGLPFQLSDSVTTYYLRSSSFTTCNSPAWAVITSFSAEKTGAKSMAAGDPGCFFNFGFAAVFDLFAVTRAIVPLAGVFLASTRMSSGITRLRLLPALRPIFRAGSKSRRSRGRGGHLRWPFRRSLPRSREQATSLGLLWRLRERAECPCASGAGGNWG